MESAAVGVTEESAECSCDCCRAAQALPDEVDYPGMKCAAPQSLENRGEAAGPQCFDAFCALAPAAPVNADSEFEDDDESDAAEGSLQSSDARFDYVRFCSERCAPADPHPAAGGFCADRAPKILDTKRSSPSVSAHYQSLPNVEAATKKKKLLLKVGDKQRRRSPRDPPVAVIEGMMLQAKDEAIRAGKAAMR